MVQLAQPVDTANGEVMTDFTPVPEGEYVIILTSSEQKETKAQDGSWYIQLNFQIVEGEFAGKPLTARLNLGNKNPAAVDMGYKELNTIGQATGISPVQDTDQFLGKAIIAEVGIQEGSGNFGPQNTIKNYKPSGQQQAAYQQQVDPNQAAQQPYQQPAQQQQPAQGAYQQQQPAQQPVQQQPPAQQQAPAEYKPGGPAPW